MFELISNHLKEFSLNIYFKEGNILLKDQKSKKYFFSSIPKYAFKDFLKLNYAIFFLISFTLKWH